jgi:hypothetical protein
MPHAVKAAGTEALVNYTRAVWPRLQQMSVFFVVKCNQLITEDTLFINQFVFLYFFSGV